MNIALILQGSNIGDRYKMIEESRKRIAENVGLVKLISKAYESEPWGFESDVWFLNRVLMVQTKLDAHQVLHQLFEIEKQLGRVRDPLSKSYSSRTIDLDILFFNQEIIHSPELDVPHPKIHLRKFTLLSLFDIVPDWIHPELMLTVRKLLENCKDEALVKNFELHSEL
ncbi:MAG: 2-amino-4-hydroxy-6-hydroxymethyldihydropteridine diphosphokinase [Bacteroidales bacterium]|nr:2-amino-4-hydroxy-6-hydroxymethyldihydropteridine diphosphokinase [Bacteroidales bacterium]MDY0217294.1 2-amino-4-hydroxy-6-hydroxymethyldihydropteridine diphosphokinase [Bacteroidales bacterium]